MSAPAAPSDITMRSPEGRDFPNKGQYLEVVPGRKLVFTDAFTGDWVPSESAPFFTAVLTFEDAGGGKTKHTARAPLERGIHAAPRADGIHTRLDDLREADGGAGADAVRRCAGAERTER
ncbi:MAG: SRPBCC domain-containing protein [Hyphomonadaceae bacterium]